LELTAVSAQMIDAPYDNTSGKMRIASRVAGVRTESPGLQVIRLDGLSPKPSARAFLVESGSVARKLLFVTVDVR
jgi:hypothetical protein